jgi:hypothetical protein
MPLRDSSAITIAALPSESQMISIGRLTCLDQHSEFRILAHNLGVNLFLHRALHESDAAAQARQSGSTRVAARRYFAGHAMHEPR